MSRHCVIAIVLVLASQAVWPAPVPRALAQCRQVNVVSPNPGANDLFGYSVATAPGFSVVTALRENAFWENSGAAYVITPIGPGEYTMTLLIPNPLISSGRSVAADEGRVVVGSSSYTAAHVFELSGGVWSDMAELVGSDSEWGDFFGWWVAVDGDTVVIGAPQDANENGGRAGAAYVFERDPNGVWLEKQKLIASDGQPADAFGQTVAIDGDVIVVGAPDDDDLGFATGSAYIFERDPNSAVWVEVQKLHPIVHTGMDIFGDAVAVSGDGILVGASQTDYAGVWTGVAYVFRRTAQRDGSVTWELEQALTPTEPVEGEAFGQSVAIDGDRAVVGAWYSYQYGPHSGAAYAFDRDPNSGVWSQTAKLVPLDGQAYDEFGYSVAVSGTTAVVGAWKDDDMGTDSGSAYIFDLAGGDCNANGWCDDVDIAGGTSQDANANGIPDECDCWGDLDGSGFVDLADLSALLTNFGLPSGMQYSDGDLDGDGDVDLADLSALLERYGVECP